MRVCACVCARVRRCSGGAGESALYIGLPINTQILATPSMNVTLSLSDKCYISSHYKKVLNFHMTTEASISVIFVAGRAQWRTSWYLECQKQAESLATTPSAGAHQFFKALDGAVCAGHVPLGWTPALPHTSLLAPSMSPESLMLSP